MPPDAPGVSPEVRALLEAHRWETTIPRLLHYTLLKARRLTWSGARGGPLPGGREAMDVVHQAVAKVFAGERRWNPAAEPDLGAYLAGVVDSELSNLVRGWDHRHVRPDAAVGVDGLPRLDRAAPAPTPLEALTGQEGEREGEVFLRAFRATLGDDPVLQQLVDLVAADVDKPADLAARLGITAAEVYNLKKRLRRALMAFRARRPAS